jgi:hypothetical protein
LASRSPRRSVAEIDRGMSLPVESGFYPLAFCGGRCRTSFDPEANQSAPSREVDASGPPGGTSPYWDESWPGTLSRDGNSWFRVRVLSGSCKAACPRRGLIRQSARRGTASLAPLGTLYRAPRLCATRGSVAERPRYKKSGRPLGRPIGFWALA